MVYVDIHNFTSAKINKNSLERVAEAVLKNMKISGEVEISLAIVGRVRMRTLNKKYRGKDQATDILSFPEITGLAQLRQKRVAPDSSREHGIKKFITPPTGVMYLGEIVICAPVAKKRARDRDHSFKKEMTILLIHGILHLLRYDHEKSKKEAEEMRRAEEGILSEVVGG